MPKVSVITTVRNGMEGLSRCASSIVAQSYGDWEWLVADDGSVDGSFEWLVAFALEEPRVKVLRNEVPGRGRALNTCLRHSAGVYVANLDCDDWWDPGFLQGVVSALEADSSYSVITTRAVVVIGMSEGGVQEQRAGPVMDKGAKVGLVDVTARLAHSNQVFHSGCLYRLEQALAVGGYDEARTSQFDYDLWVRMLGMGSRIGLLPVSLAFKSVHERQSFEKRRHLAYVWSSVQVQLRAARCLRSVGRGVMFAVARLLWALVPQTIRGLAHSQLRLRGS